MTYFNKISTAIEDATFRLINTTRKVSKTRDLSTTLAVKLIGDLYHEDLEYTTEDFIEIIFRVDVRLDGEDYS
jgi:hypothetical protein